MTLKPVLSLDPDDVVANFGLEKVLLDLETPPSIPGTAEP